MKTLLSAFGLTVVVGLLLSATETTTKIHNQIILTGNDVKELRQRIEGNLRQNFVVISMTAQSIAVDANVVCHDTSCPRVVKGEIIVVMERNY